MSFSITGVNHKPRFSGVYIKPEVNNSEMFAVNFMVVPDTIFRGVRYNGRTNADAATAQRVSDLGRTYHPATADADPAAPRALNTTTTNTVMLRNYNPGKLAGLLRQVVTEAPMEDYERAQVLHVLDEHTKDNEGADYSVRQEAGNNWATMTFTDQAAFDAGFTVLKTLKPADALDSLAPATPLVRGANVSTSFPSMPAIRLDSPATPPVKDDGSDTVDGIPAPDPQK